MIDHYAWGRGSETMLHFAGNPVLVLLPPLFDEANRMRRTLVDVMRALAAHGIGSVLPTLPATGDSILPSLDARLADWRDAVAGLATSLGKPCFTVAVRGGALLDAVGDHRWRLAPETGARLLRDLVRATVLSTGEKNAAMPTGAPIRLAGTPVHPDLFRALDGAVPVTGPSVCTRLLGTGPDAIAGTPLWRRAEPGEDPVLVDAIVTDLTGWVAQCANR